MSAPTRPVLFGEVLVDRFPGGEAVLGGAPFNVAWHLQAFGLAPLFLSRVGDDAAGREVLEAMRSWGMDVAGVQVDRDRPTGAVEVRITGGEPSYAILADQAYDHVQAEALPALEPGALLCHGSLALRAPVSRAALEHLIHAARPRRLVDVNLRAPWWSREAVLADLRGAAVVKLNEGELALLVPAAGASESPTGLPAADSGDLASAARALLAATGAERAVVTRGAAGALVVPRAGAPIEGVPRGDTSVVDTVGAGDAFTAILLLGECFGWELEVTLQRGLDFAEAIVGRRGATSADAGLYSPFLRRWQLS